MHITTSQRKLWLGALTLLFVLEIFSVFIFATTPRLGENVGSKVGQPVMRISDLQGQPSLGGEAIMISNEEGLVQELPLCFSLTTEGFIFLLLAYVLLLAFNFWSSYKTKGYAGGAFEIILTGLFLLLWVYFDQCLTANWFPFFLLKTGLLLYLAAQILIGYQASETDTK